MGYVAKKIKQFLSCDNQLLTKIGNIMKSKLMWKTQSISRADRIKFFS